MTLVEKAEQFARRLHEGQRYGSESYADAHLARVVQNLRDAGIADEALLAAGWLHDVIEDTSQKAEMLLPEFGPRVTELVEAVTSEPGRNRHERNVKTYPKIARDPGAVVVKLADRLANAEASRANNVGKWTMYRKEHQAFRYALFQSNLNWPSYYVLWDRLDHALK